MGKTISDKGSIYAKASLLHEFAGNADTYLNPVSYTHLHGSFVPSRALGRPVIDSSDLNLPGLL